MEAISPGVSQHLLPESNGVCVVRLNGQRMAQRPGARYANLWRGNLCTVKCVLYWMRSSSRSDEVVCM